MKVNRSRKRIVHLPVISLGLFLSFCISISTFAQAQKEDSSVLVKMAFRAGEIDRETYLLHRVQAIFAPELLPARFRSLVKIKPNREYTFVLREIRLQWDTFREETRQKLKAILVRPTDSTYYVGLGSNMAYTVSEATPYDTAHFRIHYVTSTADAPSLTDSDSDSVPDYVESMGTEFENVYTTEITTMGYTAPPSDGTKGGNSKFDVYIKNIGAFGVYGWADPEGSSSGNSWYSFMVMDDDYSNAEFPTNTPLENMQVTAAHEFHHAVQFGYNVNTDSWLMEATATWMEDEVYDNVNDNLMYLDEDDWSGNLAWFKRPQASLDLWTGTDHWHSYGSWIWNRCLSERHGRDIVRDIWDGCKTKSSLVAINDVLNSKGTNFTDAFADFTARNYTKVRRYIKSATIGEPYEEGSTYPNIKIENSGSPHSSYPIPTQNKLIDNLASRYFKFVPQSGAAAKTLQISFNGPNGKDCSGLVVFETKDGRKIDKRITLNANKDGTAIVSGFGTNVRNYADVDSAILIMGNATQADDGQQFSYSAQYVTGQDPQITPWGWSWGYKSPFWQSPDIWVDTDSDGVKNEPANPSTGQEAEPSIGRVNKLYAKIRNLGSSPATSVVVNFSYIPAGIGTTAYRDIDTKTVSLAVGAEQDVPVNWDLTNLNEDNGGQWPVAIKDHDHFCVKVTLQSTGDINVDNNLAKNNFGNVPVLTPPSPKLKTLKFMLANPKNRLATAGLIISPPLPKEWTIRFQGLDRYSSFPLKANEQRLVTMMITPPTIPGGDDHEHGGFASEFIGRREDAISEQLINVSGLIDGEIIGGMSYNLILIKDEKEEFEKRCTLSLHTGTATPIGALNNNYDPDYSIGLDFGYYLTPQLSIFGLLGYNRFDSSSSAIDDTYWWNLSANLKYEFSTDPVRPYINGGPGIYVREHGSTELGFNVGLGVDYSLTSDWVVELGADYHNAVTSSIDAQFIVTHIGLIYKF